MNKATRQPKLPPANIICPYCGTRQSHKQTDEEGTCETCGGQFDAFSRQASQNEMGPWYIRNENNPFKPGCSYQTLVRLIKRGSITEHTILRGPTTLQFWQLANTVRGISHLFGKCHTCEATVKQTATTCSTCRAQFAIKTGRQILGLSQSRDLNSLAQAVANTQQMNQQPELLSVGSEALRDKVNKMRQTTSATAIKSNHDDSHKPNSRKKFQRSRFRFRVIAAVLTVIILCLLVTILYIFRHQLGITTGDHAQLPTDTNNSVPPGQTDQ